MSVSIILFAILLNAQAEYIKFHPRQRDPEPPKWPEKYYAEGTLNLPYAEISEPFAAWFDSEKKSSRIDYYGGR